MKQKITKQYYQNCTNKRKPVFTLHIGGLKIHLCKNCWVGFAYGLKQDFEEFNTNESGFMEHINQTKKFEKEIIK